MAGRCTGCWCARTVERELPPVAERHGGSSRTAAAAGCQRAGGYGGGLGTLAAAAASLVIGPGTSFCATEHGLRAAPRSSAGTRSVFGWYQPSRLDIHCEDTFSRSGGSSAFAFPLAAGARTLAAN